MKFLVILISLTINYLWLKDFDRFDDSWFFRLHRLIAVTFSRLETKTEISWLVPVVSVYALLLLALLVLLQLANGILYGFITMLIHISVLLVALDRTQPGKLASEFLTRWRRGDSQGTLLFLQGQGLCAKDRAFMSDSEIYACFKEQLIYRCFEKMFIMVFSYLLAGAFGVLFAYASYQLRDSHDAHQNEKQVNLVAGMIAILEWIPVRLLALTFSLVGNFVLCFDQLKPRFLDFTQRPNSADLYEYASCALSGRSGTGAVSGEPSPAQFDLSDEVSERLEQAGEVEALQALLERSQAIWLVALALFTLLGLQLA